MEIAFIIGWRRFFFGSGSPLRGPIRVNPLFSRPALPLAQTGLVTTRACVN